MWTYACSEREISIEMFPRVSPHNLLWVYVLWRGRNFESSLPPPRTTIACFKVNWYRRFLNGMQLCLTCARNQVVVKILKVMKDHLLAEDPNFEARTRLINEAYNLRLLSASRHPNFPVLLGFDSKSMPYHIITAFECWGNLRKFLQRRQDVESRDQAVHHLRMLDGVVCALSHLEKLGLVHRCVNAENILVGDNFVCKLSGLHSLRRLTLESTEQGILFTKIFAEYRTRVHLHIKKQIRNCDFRPNLKPKIRRHDTYNFSLTLKFNTKQTKQKHQSVKERKKFLCHQEKTAKSKGIEKQRYTI